jgi:hypothetical protein
MPDGRAETEGEPDWKGNCGGETATIQTDDARRCFAPTGTRRIAPIATGEMRRMLRATGARGNTPVTRSA